MVDVISNFKYKTAGRGRGVLGVKDLTPSRRPGEKAAGGARKKESVASGQTTSKEPKSLGRPQLISRVLITRVYSLQLWRWSCCMITMPIQIAQVDSLS